MWWQQPFRMFQTNLREIDAGFDVEKVADYLADFGADTWLLSIGGIVSNYPTKLDFQTPNPALELRESGDLVGDVVEAAAARGIRVVGRMDFSKIDRRRFEQRPDWCFVNAAGDNQVYNGLVSTCPSGEYYQERVHDVLTEVVSGYDVAGFFFNWMSFNEVDYSRRYWGVCQCLACQRRFAAFAPGEALPAGPDAPGYDLWRQFAHQSLEDLTGRVVEHLHELRPDAALILGDRADIAFHEANNAIGRPLWHHRTSESVSIATTLRPQRPVLVNSVAFVDMPYRLAGEDPHHFRQYLIQAIARGANPSTYIMGTPDDSPYACLDGAAAITRFHRDHHDTYLHLRPAASTVLVRPDPLDYDAERFSEINAEYQGIHLALIEGHLPFDVATSSALAGLTEHGSRYTTVILPDLGRLSDDAVTALDAFRAAGGAILTTGGTGFVGDRMQLADSPVARRLASYATAEATRSLVVTTDHAGHRWGHPLPVVGAFHVVEPVESALADLPALSRAPYGPPEKSHGHLDTGHPGRLTSADGRLVVLPWTVGRVYREVGLTAARDLLVQQVRRTTADDRQVDTDLPEQVEIILSENEHGPVVHLLNRSGDRDQRFTAVTPIGPGTLRIPITGPVTEVSALCAGRTLDVTTDAAGYAEITTPTLNDFEVVQLHLVPVH